MDEEKLKINYTRARQELEEQEQDIKAYRKKGEQLFEESRKSLYYYLQDFAIDDEPLNQALREFAQREEEYLEILSEERKAIIQKQEDVDEKYYRDLRKLIEENK
ncbi:hypothetical protein [Candidatus Enterococcus palustris]|uniref:hypothetical protein n=1 Tax=Candidatus Enterococcus palustris TaxID=1834189 RepID=UPI000A34588B|nr:hypothetical protein [Enterococcus sp. 7F3_DIV0205]